MKKRILTSVLSLCLLVGLLPTVALAVSEPTVADESELRAALTDETADTIILSEDITLNAVLEIGRSVKINGVGKKITIASSVATTSDASMITIKQPNGTDSVTVEFSNITLDAGIVTSTNYETKSYSASEKQMRVLNVGPYADVTLGDDVVITGGYASTGGGCVVESASILSIDGATIQYNISERGGGIELNGWRALSVTTSPARLTMKSGYVQYNKASSNGGGILLNSCTNCELQGGIITNNYCGARGGGVGVIYGFNTFILDGAEITNNIANVYGGGIGNNNDLNASCDFYIKSGSVYNNVANNTSNEAGRGDEIKISDATDKVNTFTMSGGKVYNNIGGRDVISIGVDDAVIISGGEISATESTVTLKANINPAVLSGDVVISKLDSAISDKVRLGTLKSAASITFDATAETAVRAADNCTITAADLTCIHSTDENLVPYLDSQNNQIVFRSLVLNGGSFTATTNFATDSLAIPEKEGVIFGGWYGNADFSGEPVTIPIADQTYYAKWVHKITFEANGGTGTMNTQEIPEGTISATLTENSFTKTGYTFSGWNTAADGSGTSYANQGTAPSTSTTLYAQWTPNTYTIQFNANGGTGTMAGVEATYDTPVTLPQNAFTKQNAKFAGWAKTSSADDGMIDFSDQTAVLNLAQSGTATLYAVWTDKAVLEPDLTDTVVTYNGQPQSFHVDNSYTLKYYQNRMPVGNPTNAGVYDVEISRAEDDTYASYHGYIAGGLRINPAALTIKADNKSVYVGDEMPAFTYTPVGLVEGDEITDPTFVCEVSNTNTEGQWTITPSDADAGDNYTITYADGTLTVSRRSSGGGGSSSSGSSSNTTTETVTNKDGSKTTIVTDKKTGTVTETTKYKDGSTLVVETKKDGTVTTTETAKNGVKVRTVDEPGENVTATVTIPRSVGEATVTIPADVDYGMVAVDADTGEIVKLSVPTKDGMLVKLDGSAALVLVDNSKRFADTRNHWAEDAIDFATAHEMFSGTSETTFTPDSPMTRAMLMTVLARFDGEDTNGGSVWYEKGMAWAIANGVSDGSNPNGSITREQFATMLWRYTGSPSVDGSLSGFSDSAKVNGYAVDAMRWAVSSGIIGGMGDGTLAPQGNATRAQVATMLMRFVENLTK